MDIGNKIHFLRIKLGMSTRELAKLTGVSHATISRWETGRTENLFVGNIDALAKALQVTPMYLIGVEDNCDDFQVERVCNKIKTLSHDDLIKLEQMIDLMFKK